jgi:hypothetical protein
VWKCDYYLYVYHFDTKSTSQTNKTTSDTTAPTLAGDANVVVMKSAAGAITFPVDLTGKTVSSTDWIKIIWPPNVRLDDECVYSGGDCTTFQGNRWMMLKPSGDVTGSGATLAITTHNAWFVNEGDIIGHNYKIQAYID